MQVTVFGANGKVGRLVVDQLVQNGDTVVAFVHSSSPFTKEPNIKTIQGDIYDAEAVESAVVGSQAVISTLGSWHTSKKDILAAGMRNIIPAMQKQKVDKIVTLTGSEASSTNDPQNRLHSFIHKLLELIKMKVLEDGDEHIRLLESSGLDWTVLRSPVMNDYGDAHKYELSREWPAIWATVNRESVAQAIVFLVKDSSYKQSAPFIKRG